ncbi:MAG: phosphotransferase family protein [Alphaproteobacteria bacterium]|nr:MAG: phosphotransferase family protein [Alphaproteobacteria bacterium]
MARRSDLFAGTMPVPPERAFSVERLTDYLVERIADLRPPLAVRQFRGGQSNPTYLLTDAAGRRLVLRRKPPGPLLPSAHQVEREYRVISALHRDGRVPVARPHLLCEDETVIGSVFYVMDHVEGRIFWDAHVPEVSREERAAIFDAMNRTIAALHGIEPAAVGLGDYGKPGNYFARQISRWSRQYLADEEAGRIPAMDRLVAWLPEHVPAGDETAIVHGDFRIDNMIFAPDRPEVVAVLDWELSTLGHPLADFAYHLMMYRMPANLFAGLKGLDLAALGIPDEEAYLARYCERVGRPPVSRADLDFAIAFNMFRLAAILHGIKGRVARGTAANPRAAEMARLTEPLAELAWAQVERLAD